VLDLLEGEALVEPLAYVRPDRALGPRSNRTRELHQPTCLLVQWSRIVERCAELVVDGRYKRKVVVAELLVDRRRVIGVLWCAGHLTPIRQRGAAGREACLAAAGASRCPQALRHCARTRPSVQLLRRPDGVLGLVGQASLWDDLLAAEPEPHRLADDAALLEAARVMVTSLT
jgi:hypothetical protein